MRFAPLLLAAALLHAEAPQLPEPYQSIAGLAYAAPPEFAADALLRMVEFGGLPDKGPKRDLIEQAFRLAAAAKFPVRMTGLPGTTADTRSGSLSQAYAFGFDALSLQSRAVRDMLPVDPAKARELFGDIAPPMLAPLTCDDALVYDVADYYRALEGVVNLAFTPKERAKQEDVSFLLDYLGQAASPAQIVALVPVVQSASVTPPQREVLWAKLNGLLENLQPDERSFSASLPALDALNVPEMKSALAAYQQRGHVCEHDAGATPSSGKKPGQQDPDATPKVEPYWQSTAAQQLFQDGQKLRFTPRKGLRNEADRSSPEFQQQLDDYLGQVNGWTPGLEKSEADFYHEKCDVYQSLVELVPAGPQQEQLLDDYVSFLSNSNLYLQSPVEWFVGPQALMERVQGDGQELREVFDAFLASGNPVLALEAKLRQVIRTSTLQWFTSQR
ncbi:MAG TPA: hypothetical protein VMB25_15705 [Bryobacteraceae bacterium]|nr:hypothetical protein [Bryobacteraceae bacterium]